MLCGAQPENHLATGSERADIPVKKRSCARSRDAARNRRLRWPIGRDGRTTPTRAPPPPWRAWPWGCAPPDNRRREARGSAAVWVRIPLGSTAPGRFRRREAVSTRSSGRSRPLHSRAEREAPTGRQHPHMAHMRTSCRVSAALRAHHLDRGRRLKVRCQRSSKA